MRIQPTLKFIKAGYIIGILALLAGAGLFFPDYSFQNPGVYVMAVAVLFLLFVVRRHIKRNLVRITVTDTNLRCETGIFSKSTRLIQLSKLQDVRVDQSALQRIFNVGSLSLETAGESSRFEIDNIDAPHSVAEMLLGKSQQA